VKSGLSTIRSLGSTVPRNVPFLVALVTNFALPHTKGLKAGRVSEAIPGKVVWPPTPETDDRW